MPPSSTGAGGVGASCVRDADCQSGLCGVDNKGGHMCYAANANANNGVGCNVGGGDGSSGLGLTLLLGLAFKLGRARRRGRR
jgi:hypothetical protein